MLITSPSDASTGVETRRQAHRTPDGVHHLGSRRDYVLGDVLPHDEPPPGPDVLNTARFDTFGLYDEHAAGGKGHVVGLPVWGTPYGFPVFVPDGTVLDDAAFVAVAPGHPDVERLLASAAGWHSLPRPTTYHRWCRQLAQARAQHRTRRNQQHPGGRFGFDTGIRLVHPTRKALLPVWTVSYLPPHTGPTSRVGVPPTNDDDRTFAQRHGIQERLAPPRCHASWPEAGATKALQPERGEAFAGEPLPHQA